MVLKMDEIYYDLYNDVCTKITEVNPETLYEVVVLAVEIAREGREGRKIGTMFVVGDTEEVLNRSKCLILDPLYGHPNEVKSIYDFNLRETVK
ncbi:MAG: hypothetical protein D6828_04370, partial [Nitrospirae bacterium]